MPGQRNISNGLTGLTALVTGASRGIGAACALQFAEAGADVAISARDPLLSQPLSAQKEPQNKSYPPGFCPLRYGFVDEGLFVRNAAVEALGG